MSDTSTHITPRRIESASQLLVEGSDLEGFCMLETLLCETFGEEDVCTCIDEFFACVKELQGADPRKPFKARARVYLATKPDPHLSVGVAAKRRILEPGSPCASTSQQLSPRCRGCSLVAPCVRRPYSNRSDSIGSRRAACRAG